MNKNFKIIIFIFSFNFLFINYIFSSEKDYFLTLKYNEVKVRQGPSSEYPVKFIYNKKYLPVKVIDSKDNFRKIIDLKNNSGWIHISQLTTKKSAINIFDLTLIFKKPNIYSKPIAKLESGKMVTIKRCKDKWCKISTQNISGWVKKKFLWGKF